MYLVLLLCLFLFFNKKQNELSWYYTNIDTVLISTLLAVSCLSVLRFPPLFNYDFGRARLGGEYLSLITMISCIGIYQMTKRFVISKKNLLTLLKIMVVSGSIASLAGYLQLINPSNTYLFKYIVVAENIKWTNRIAATMPGYELLSEYSMLLIMFTLILIIGSRSKKEKMVHCLFLLNLFLMLPLTQTRGIYVAIAAGLFYAIILLFFLGRIKTSIKALIYSAVVVTLLIGTIFVIDLARPESRFVERLKPDKINISISEGKFDTRTPAWLFGWELIGSSSTLEKVIGSGYKYFGKRAGVMKLTGWPHSLYLSYILRDGFLGLLVLFAFFAWLYVKSIQAILISCKFDDMFWYKVSIILHVALVIFFINETKIEFIRHDRTQNIMWVFFAVITVSSAMIQRIKRETMIKHPTEKFYQPINAL